MNGLLSYLKKIQIGSILTIFTAGVALFLTAAFNSGNLEGASLTTSAAIGSPVGLPNSAQLIAVTDAANATNKNPNGIIYSAPDTQERPGIGQVDPGVFERDAESTSAQRQPVIDRSDPNVKILEKVGDAFKEGSSFLRSSTDKASEEALENAERKGEW